MVGPAGLEGEVWGRPIEPVVIAKEGIGVADPIDVATDAAGVAAGSKGSTGELQLEIPVDVDEGTRTDIS